MYIHSTNISAETMREFRGETFFVLPSSNREFSFLLLYLTCLQGLELPAGGAPGAPHFVGHYEYPSLPWIFQGFLRFNTKKIVVKVALNLPALLALMFLSIVLYKKRTSFFAWNAPKFTASLLILNPLHETLSKNSNSNIYITNHHYLIHNEIKNIFQTYFFSLLQMQPCQKFLPTSC